MSGICIIGDRGSILPFKAFGVATFEAGKPEEARELIDSMTPEEYDVVLIVEELMQGLEEMGLKPGMNMVVIPGHRGSSGYGKLLLKKSIQKAIGTGGQEIG